jgi:hypothetical protein
LSYPLIRDQKVNLNIFIGAAFNVNGSKHLFNNKIQSEFALINKGKEATKDIEIFDYKLPVYATVMCFPANKIARKQLDIGLFYSFNSLRIDSLLLKKWPYYF